MKLTGVTIGTDNPKELGEFYIKLFGKPGWQQDDWYGFDIGGNALMIGSHSEVHGKNESPARIMIALESSDVAKEFDRMVGLGCKTIAKPYQPSKEDNPNTWLATLADLDGNYLQLSSPWEK